MSRVEFHVIDLAGGTVRGKLSEAHRGALENRDSRAGQAN
jgi:hypothetical protein